MQRSATRFDNFLEPSSRFSNLSNIAHHHNNSNIHSKFNLNLNNNFTSIFESEQCLSNPQFLSALKRQPTQETKETTIESNQEEDEEEEDEYERYMRLDREKRRKIIELSVKKIE